MRFGSLLVVLACASLSGCYVPFAISDVVKDPTDEAVDTDLTAPVGDADSDAPGGDSAAPVNEDTATSPVEDTDVPPPADDCTVTSDLIYLLERDTQGLYLFDPATLTSTRLGRLACTSGATPASMAVARDGVAYVRYSNDAVYEVDLVTLGCTATSYSPGATGFGSFGMGFATDSAGTWMDHLYVANFHRLAQLDTTSWQGQVIGAVPSQSELTGNSLGELWAFFPLERPARLSQLDKVTGAESNSINLPGFPAAIDIDTFAFAAWGGDFWLFVRTYGVGSSTDVYRVHNGSMTMELQRMGFDVVGAGVSTCSPTP